MLHSYKYIKLPGEEKRFFCIHQTFFSLVWLLFFEKNTLLPRTNPNGLAKWSPRWIKNELRGYYSFSRNNARKLLNFIRYKFHFRNIDSSVDLPFYGQTCVLVNKGHKIFDLRRKVAIKVYRDDVDVSTITAELERLKKGSLFDFAPSIRRWNIKERWYEEDYITGSLDRSDEPMHSSYLLEKFYKDIVPCFEIMMLHQSPLKINTFDYADKILTRTTRSANNLHMEGADITKVNNILNFINSMVRQLKSEGNLPIFLVLTHGDFCPANMLNTKRGLRVLDWESTTHRSALFDFYSYFFFRPRHQKLPLAAFMPEIKVALSFYLSKLALIAPAVSGSVNSYEKVYRWLFYIERISMLVDRVKYDTKLNVMDSIRRYIEVFNSYEEISVNVTKKPVVVEGDDVVRY